jgi:uracil-DNA glycosylase family 4
MIFPDNQDGCAQCPLGRGKKVKHIPYVPTESRGGRDEVDVMFVGEAPGEAEDAKRMPFVGQSGTLLRNTVRDVFPGAKVAYTNIVRCRPTDEQGKDRKPSEEEIRACRNYALRDIKKLNPKLVVLTGSTATLHGTSSPLWGDSGVMKVHGQVAEHKERKYLPVFHPSYVVRNLHEKTKWVNDLRRGNSALTGEEVSSFSKKGKSKHLDTLSKVKDLLRYIRKEHKGPVALDIETENLYRVASNKILSVQLALDGSKGYVILLEHKSAPWTVEEREDIIKMLKRTLTKAKKVTYWITHGGKFDYDKLSSRYKIVKWSAPIIDTSFMAHLLDDNRARDKEADNSGASDGYKLSVLAEQWLMFDHYKTSGIKQQRHEIEKVKLPDFIDYGGMDAYVTYRLHDYILESADKENYRNKLLRLAIKWGSRVLEMIPTMERWGIYVDRKQLMRLKGKDSPIRKRIAEIHELLGKSKAVQKTNKKLLGADKRVATGMKPLFGAKDPWIFDANKKDHLVALFIDVLGLEPLEYGANDVPAIDKAFLRNYAPDDDVDPWPRSVYEARLIKELRGLSKLESSYINSILSFLENNPDCADGRIRASFSVINAVTGRWASMDPNIQQVPRADNEAKASVKSLYRAAPGHILFEADYGQAEVRWWAQIAGDRKFAERFAEMKALRAKYNKNPTPELKAQVKAFCDIHRQVASMMFEVDIQKVTDDQRQAAKSLAFGSIYGQSHYTLAKILKKTPDEALAIQQRFLQAFPDAGNWLTSIEKDAERHGYVESPLFRRRRLHALFATGNKSIIGGAKRNARNSPIQGVSSDTTALSAWLMWQHIQKNKLPWKIVDVVHDSILLEVPLDFKSIRECDRVLREIMTVKVFELINNDFNYKVFVPFEVDVKLGLSLGHMSKDITDEDSLKAVVKELSKKHKAELAN